MREMLTTFSHSIAAQDTKIGAAVAVAGGTANTVAGNVPEGAPWWAGWLLTAIGVVVPLALGIYDRISGRNGK